jgi:DNA-binding NarL/FixJ family response regulator
MTEGDRERTLERYRAHARTFEALAAEHRRLWGDRDTGSRRPAPASEHGSPVLSKREVEVLALIARGFGNAEIGRWLHISDEAVKAHIGAIMLSLGTRDRAHAVRVGIEQGVIGLCAERCRQAVLARG